MGGFLTTTVLMLLLLFSGIWVAVALGFSALFGLTYTFPIDKVVSLLGKVMWEQNTNFVLVAVPLFIFMGEIMFQCGIMSRIYTAASKLVSGIPGGLLQTNIAACTIFAACSGSSVASAATIGSVGYPLIRPRGYNRQLALGSIAAGGTLGILIPPSIILIIYGSLAEVSIGRLFMAGLIPGLLLASLFALLIALWALVQPSVAPREPTVTLGEMARAAASLWQVAVLALVVLGGIYGGIASPTEVAGLGAALAVVFAAIYRSLTWQVLYQAGLNTVRQSSMSLFIVISAKLLSMMLIYQSIPSLMLSMLDAFGASPLAVVLMLCVLYLLMGMFFDGVSMMVMTIPFVIPIVSTLHVDLIWLGILIVLIIEIGLLTPPVGLNLYVLQGATNEPIRDVIIGSLPFLGIQALMVLLLFLFPQLALYLPGLLF